MKKLGIGLSAALIAAGLVLVLFFTSFIAVVFNRPFVFREMRKYGVPEAVGMEEEDVDSLFDETLKYLEHKRDDLVIETRVKGQTREAYNEQEKLHMVDVLGLFDGGWCLYFCAIGAVLAAAVIFLVWKKERSKLGRAYAKGFLIALAVFFVLVGAIAIAFLIDFDACFTKFHLIFFDNDLWLMDPRKCLMINIMPEGFFFDAAIRIAVLFLAMTLVMGVCCVICLKKPRKADAEAASVSDGGL